MISFFFFFLIYQIKRWLKAKSYELNHTISETDYKREGNTNEPETIRSFTLSLEIEKQHFYPLAPLFPRPRFPRPRFPRPPRVVNCKCISLAFVDGLTGLSRKILFPESVIRSMEYVSSSESIGSSSPPSKEIKEANLLEHKPCSPILLLSLYTIGEA